MQLSLVGWLTCFIGVPVDQLLSLGGTVLAGFPPVQEDLRGLLPIPRFTIRGQVAGS